MSELDPLNPVVGSLLVRAIRIDNASAVSFLLTHARSLVQWAAWRDERGEVLDSPLSQAAAFGALASLRVLLDDARHRAKRDLGVVPIPLSDMVPMIRTCWNAALRPLLKTPPVSVVAGVSGPI